MGRAYGNHWKRENMFIQDFGLKRLKERVWLEDLGVDGKMRLNGMVK
jgi:hypothetical protein